jgi:hypothetical protein
MAWTLSVVSIFLLAGLAFVVPKPRPAWASVPAFLCGWATWTMSDHWYYRFDEFAEAWWILLAPSLMGVGLAAGFGHLPSDARRAALLGIPYGVGGFFVWGSGGGEPVILALPIFMLIGGAAAAVGAAATAGTRWFISRFRRRSAEHKLAD